MGSDARWLYAASLTPIEVMSPMELRQQTTDQTELPYSGRALSAGLSGANDSGTQQFFYDMSAAKRQHDQDGNPREKRARPTFDQGIQWYKGA